MENEPVREESSEGINLTHEIQLEDARSDSISLLSADVSATVEPVQDTEDEEENVANTNEKCFTADSLETIRSGESVFKLFTFDPEKCTANVDKCMAFWKKIDEMDLKPVNCSLYKPKKEEPQKETCEFDEGGDEAIAEEIESEVGTQETKTNIDAIQISWCEALNELKKRNLDKVARVSKPLCCKMCRALAFDMDYDDQQDNEHEDIVALNDWNPQKLKKTQKKLTQEDGEERLSNKSVVVCKNVSEEKKQVPKENVVAATKDEAIKQSKTEEVEAKIKKPAVKTKDEEVELKIKQPVLKTKDAETNQSKIEKVKITQPVVKTKDADELKIKQPVLKTKDEEIKQSKTEVVEVKIKPPVVKTKDEEIKQSKTEVEAKINKPVVKTKGEDALKIKESNVETKTAKEASEEKTKVEHIDSETKTRESLNLMENLLKDVLAKMSEEIDAHVNVKELVNEIIATAVQKIKTKKRQQLKTQIPTPKRKEENQYKIPPYSMTGDYPCVCNEFDCKCAAQTPKSTVEAIKSASVEKNRILIKQLKKNSISTQFPELAEKIISAASVKGGFCKICGLCECICRYIQENSETDIFVNTSSNW